MYYCSSINFANVCTNWVEIPHQLFFLEQGQGMLLGMKFLALTAFAYFGRILLQMLLKG